MKAAKEKAGAAQRRTAGHDAGRDARLVLTCGWMLLGAASGSAQEESAAPPAYERTFESPDALADFVFSDADAWHWSAGGTLALAQSSDYAPPHRSPRSIALLDEHEFGDFVLETELRQTGREYGHRDLCLFFGFQDPAHYYYVHLATSPDPNAHNVFLVDDAPRRNLAPVAESGVDWGTDEWHTVRVERSLAEGSVVVSFDGREVLRAQDTTHGWGRIGWGSFDDTGEMRRVRIWADEVRPASTPLPFSPKARVLTAKLGSPDADGIEPLGRAFAAANPGYELSWHRELRELPGAQSTRILFVQDGESEATVLRNGGAESCDPALVRGDVVLLRPGDAMHLTGSLDALEFQVPEAFPEHLPTFVRPDWDPHITDTPGGCAEETGAYRRILLTWLHENGPYVYHALNCHRVRITDSFTHYHPLEGGFDEFYLVQMVQPGARLLTSRQVAAIESGVPDRAAAGDLLQTRELAVGDLVYMPRGTIHRGLGGVLAQVITTPGFRPGAEIGVDHHLQRINTALGLEGDDALPLHAANAHKAVTK